MMVHLLCSCINNNNITLLTLHSVPLYLSAARLQCDIAQVTDEYFYHHIKI